MEEEKKILINYIISYLVWNIVLSTLFGSTFKAVIEVISATVLIENFDYILSLIITALLSIISNSILTLINHAIASHSAFHKVKTISSETANNLIISILQFYIFANFIFTIILYFINNNFSIISLVMAIINLLIGSLVINCALKNYIKRFIIN